MWIMYNEILNIKEYNLCIQNNKSTLSWDQIFQ